MTQKEILTQLDELTELTENIVRLIENYEDALSPEHRDTLEDYKDQLIELTKNNSSAYA